MLVFPLDVMTPSQDVSIDAVLGTQIINVCAVASMSIASNFNSLFEF